MKIVFACALKQRVFRSDEYRVIEHRGVSVDAAGRKSLDMKVQLSSPCPFCGELHIYTANELACPMTSHPAGQ